MKKTLFQLPKKFALHLFFIIYTIYIFVLIQSLIHNEHYHYCCWIYFIRFGNVKLKRTLTLLFPQSVASCLCCSVSDIFFFSKVGIWFYFLLFFFNMLYEKR